MEEIIIDTEHKKKPVLKLIIIFVLILVIAFIFFIVLKPKPNESNVSANLENTEPPIGNTNPDLNNSNDENNKVNWPSTTEKNSSAATSGSSETEKSKDKESGGGGGGSGKSGESDTNLNPVIIETTCNTGTGTINDPKVICTAQELSDIRNNLNLNYILGADIDLEEFNWASIGTQENQFTGSLNGNGYKIKNQSTETLFDYANNAVFNNVDLVNINLNNTEASTAGLVNTISNSQISNCDISGDITGQFASGLANNIYFTTIQNSSFTGSISSDSVAGGLVGNSEDSEINSCNTKINNVSGKSQVGGLAGNALRTTIRNSYSKGDLENSGDINESNDGCAGGLVGQAIDSSIYFSNSNNNIYGSVGLGGLVGCMGNLYNSYATGNIYSTNANILSQYVGGLAGKSNIISNSFSIGDISVTGKASKVGGLVGLTEGDIINSYSTGNINITGTKTEIGGLIGYLGLNTVTSSYWDTQNSGLIISAGGVGKTTTQMKQQSTFVSWDFTEIWNITESTTYPFLR